MTGISERRCKHSFSPRQQSFILKKRTQAQSRPSQQRPEHPPTSPPPAKPIQEGPLSNPIPSPSYVMARPKQSARSRTTPSLRASPSLEKGEQVVSAVKTPHRGSIVVGDPRGHSGSYGKHFRWVFGVMWNLPLWMFVGKKRTSSSRISEVTGSSMGRPGLSVELSGNGDRPGILSRAERVSWSHGRLLVMVMMDQISPATPHLSSSSNSNSNPQQKSPIQIPSPARAEPRTPPPSPSPTPKDPSPTQHPDHRRRRVRPCHERLSLCQVNHESFHQVPEFSSPSSLQKPPAFQPRRAAGPTRSPTTTPAPASTAGAVDGGGPRCPRRHDWEAPTGSDCWCCESEN